ncbi:hypothetical protein RRG08_018123 [Elysia crispata]|uniref:Uncharacterized protein n=1 Tax=Elysia crispata TaxID=231223 RepID=A0AAE0ZUG3_9GAST|nr:hypothetical protein RRG08_018123 [Elysia crispata]
MLLEYKRRSQSFSFHTPASTSSAAAAAASSPPPPRSATAGHLRAMLLVPPSAPRMVRLVGGPGYPPPPPPSSAHTHGPRPTIWRPLPLLLRFRSQPDMTALPARRKSPVKDGASYWYILDMSHIIANPFSPRHVMHAEAERVRLQHVHLASGGFQRSTKDPWVPCGRVDSRKTLAPTQGREAKVYTCVTAERLHEVKVASSPAGPGLALGLCDEHGDE